MIEKILRGLALFLMGIKWVLGWILLPFTFLFNLIISIIISIITVWLVPFAGIIVIGLIVYYYFL